MREEKRKFKGTACASLITSSRLVSRFFRFLPYSCSSFLYRAFQLSSLQLREIFPFFFFFFVFPFLYFLCRFLNSYLFFIFLYFLCPFYFDIFFFSCLCLSFLFFFPFLISYSLSILWNLSYIIFLLNYFIQCILNYLL